MQQLPIWAQVLVSLLSILTPLILFYLKLRSDRKKAELDFAKEQTTKELERDKKEDIRLEKQTKFLSDRILEVEYKVVSVDNKVDNLEKKLDGHVSDSEFKLGFQNKVSNLSVNLLRASDLDFEYKSILDSWFNRIEKLCTWFYYSPLRKKEPRALENSLIEKFELLLGEYNHYIDLTIKEVRLYNGDKYSLSKFLEKTSFFGKSKVLINTLVINGLDEAKFQNLVLNHMDTFYSDFIQMLRVWKKLKKQTIFSDLNDEEAA
jgi:hypothetical protein